MSDDKTVFDLIRDGDGDGLRAYVTANPGAASRENDAGITAVMVALYHQRRDLADVLLGDDPDLNIFEACALGDAPFVRRMLDDFPGFLAGTAADGFTPLHLAVFFGHGSVVSLLLERGADVNARADNPMKVSPLHSAASMGSVALVDALLRAGAEVDAQQEGGWTALQAAALHGNLEMARVLLAAGASPDLAGDDGRTAYGMAREKGHDDLVALFDAR